MPYQKSPSIDEDETAALLVTTINSLPTTTMDRRSSKTRLAVAAGMLMLVAGGTVWMGDGGITTTAEGLVVATAGDGFRCEPATNTFGGWSSDFDPARGEYSTGPFQTCYKLPIRDQRDWTTSFQFCWSNSYWIDWGVMVKHYECDPVSDEWSPISKGKFYVGRDSCGKPCQTMDHMAK